MRDDIDLSELKKKLKKRNHDKNDDTNRYSKKSAEHPKKNQSSNEAHIHSSQSSLDDSLIEDYKDEDKECATIDYENDNVETNGIENNQKQSKFKMPKIRLPKLNYLKVLLIIILFIFVGVTLYYLFSSYSEVTEFEVNGNVNLKDEEVIERSGIDTGDKMYLLKTNQAEQDIDLLPIVESIHVNRSWPNKVVIDIDEYNVVGFVESKENYYPVLENNRVLRGFHMQPANAPIVHFFEGKEFDGLVDSLKEVEPNILKQISEIYYRPNDDSFTRIQLFMNNGQEIIGDYNTIGEKINYYQGMRQEIGDQSGLIDLEVSNTFLEYSSEEARQLKQDLSGVPEHAAYLEDIDGNLKEVKKSLDQLESTKKE